MAAVVGRLKDVSVIVRRYALQLVTALLKTNSFSCKVSSYLHYKKKQIKIKLSNKNVLTKQQILAQ